MTANNRVRGPRRVSRSSSSKESRNSQGNLVRTPDVAVVTPLNNFLGPEGDTVTMVKQLLNTEY